jgi:hypothetical protein
MSGIELGRDMPLYVMVDLYEKQVIVEFNPNQQRTFIDAKLYEWLLSTERKEKICVKEENWFVIPNIGWHGWSVLSMMVGGEKVFLGARVKAGIYSEDGHGLSKVDIVVGAEDIKDEEIYLNHRKRVIRVRESQNLHYAYKQVPTFLLKNGGVL